MYHARREDRREKEARPREGPQDASLGEAIDWIWVKSSCLVSGLAGIKDTQATANITGIAGRGGVMSSYCTLQPGCV